MLYFPADREMKCGKASSVRPPAGRGAGPGMGFPVFPLTIMPTRRRSLRTPGLAILWACLALSSSSVVVATRQTPVLLVAAAAAARGGQGGRGGSTGLHRAPTESRETAPLIKEGTVQYSTVARFPSSSSRCCVISEKSPSEHSFAFSILRSSGGGRHR